MIEHVQSFVIKNTEGSRYCTGYAIIKERVAQVGYKRDAHNGWFLHYRAK